MEFLSINSSRLGDDKCVNCDGTKKDEICFISSIGILCSSECLDQFCDEVGVIPKVLEYKKPGPTSVRPIDRKYINWLKKAKGET